MRRLARSWGPFGRVIALSIVAFLTLLVVSAGVSTAGSSTTIDFETPAITTSSPVGPVLGPSDQLFDPMGIDFVQPYAQDVVHPTAIEGVPNCLPYLLRSGSGTAHSGTQVLADSCADSDHLTQVAGWLAQLHNSASQVSVYVGLPALGSHRGTVVLTGYDFQGDVVASSSSSAVSSTVSTKLSISTGAPNIYFISLQVPGRTTTSTGALEADDLTFDDPGTGTPEILLNAPGNEPGNPGPYVCADGYQGGTASCPIGIERFNGATNALTLSLSGLPSWLTLAGGGSVPSGATTAPLLFNVSSTAPVHAIGEFTISATASGSPAVSIASVNTGIAVAADFYLMADYNYGNSVSLAAGGGSEPLVTDVFTTGVPAGGTVSFKISGLPYGVTAKFSPTTLGDAPGEQFETVTFKAKATAAPVAGVKAIVTAKMSASTPVSPEKLPIFVSVTTFDLRAQAIDVTQSVQGGTLVPSGLNESGQSYQGVDLVADKTTIVRFFADAYGSPLGLAGTRAKLTASRGGTTLGSIFADYGPDSGATTKQIRLTDTGELYPAPVSYPERVGDANAYTFTLPRSWTLPFNGGANTIKLVAQVFGPSDALRQECGGATLKPPGSAVCANNTFVLKHVVFRPAGRLTVTSIRMTASGQAPGTVAQAFADVRAATPLADDGVNGLVVFPYAASYDFTSQVTGGGSVATIQGNMLSTLSSDVSGLGATNVVGVSPGIDVNGLTTTPGGGPESCPPVSAGTSCFNGAYDNPTSGGPSITAFVNNPALGADRPLTSVGHELFHQFGLVHASNECSGGIDGDSDDGGQVGEPWPPDGQGNLNGIALNTTAKPYVTIANSPTTTALAWDFMSYCAATRGFGDGGDWTSPRNWEALFSEFEVPGPGPVPFARDRGAGAPSAPARVRSVSRPPHPAAVLDAKVLRVLGFQDASGLFIGSVGPRVGPPLAHGFSRYRLVAIGAHGKRLASVAMTVRVAHSDQIAAFVFLAGEVPAAGVTAVEVISPIGQVVTRVRPLRPPRVRVLAPALGARIGGKRNVMVRWASTNSGHRKLSAAIDYSADGGRSWRTVFGGADTGRALLPAFYIAHSADGRVRVRVNDGFNETAAVSGLFRAADPPPLVAILSPGPAGAVETIDGDAPVQLTGAAFLPTFHALSGSRMRWFDNGSLLGTGGSLETGPLPTGINRITLVVRDDFGVKAAATTTVIVRPVGLHFLRLRFARRLAPGARKLRVVAVSTLVSALTINGRSFQLPVGRHALIVRIRPGRSPLLLHFSDYEGLVQVPFAARVTR